MPSIPIHYTSLVLREKSSAGVIIIIHWIQFRFEKGDYEMPPSDSIYSFRSEVNCILFFSVGIIKRLMVNEFVLRSNLGFIEKLMLKLEQHAINLQGMVKNATDGIVREKAKVDSLLYSLLPKYVTVFFYHRLCLSLVSL